MRRLAAAGIAGIEQPPQQYLEKLNLPFTVVTTRRALLLGHAGELGNWYG